MGNKQSKVHEILPFEMSTTVLFKWDRSNILHSNQAKCILWRNGIHVDTQFAVVPFGIAVFRDFGISYSFYV